MTAHPHLRTVKEPTWTPRQREVLDLLVRGKTNGEIASALSISLDGAKWHVSEIITRLGVDNRDEAAEYWRHYNGLRMRFTRVASAFFGSGVLKWSAASALVVGTVVASAMVIYGLHESGNETREPSAGDPPVSTPADPSQPGTNPGDSPGTPPVTGETLGGAPMIRATVSQPRSLPAGMSLIVEKGCYQCDGSTTGFERVTSDAAGVVSVETIFTAPGSSPTSPNSPYVFSNSFERAGAFYVSVCSRGWCGGLGQPSADAQTTIYRSTDGAVTWTAVKTLDGAARIAANGPDGVILDRSRDVPQGNGMVSEYRFENLATGEVLQMPGPDYRISYSYDGVLSWTSPDGKKVVDASGNVLFDGSSIPLADGSAIELVEFNAQAGALVGFRSGTYSYVGLVKGGKLERSFEFDSYFIVGTWLNATTVLGNFDIKESDVVPGGSPNNGRLHPVILDLTTGSVTPLELYGPAFSDAYMNKNYIKAVAVGPFLKVTGAGDCLNVREQPNTSSSVIGCFADNVLLRDLDTTENAGGIEWRKVQTPAGQQGWASSEFLR